MTSRQSKTIGKCVWTLMQHYLRYSVFCDALQKYIKKNSSQYLKKTEQYLDTINFEQNIVAAFQGMHMSPAKHSYVWLPRKRDYWIDGQTRQTDARKSDPYVSLCSAGDTKIKNTAKFWQKKYETNLIWSVLLSFTNKFMQYTKLQTNTSNTVNPLL